MRTDNQLVAVGYVHNGVEVAHSFHASMLGLYAIEPRVGWQPPIQVRCGTNGLVAARNSIMAHFLDKTTEAQWLFMIDTDMGFRPDIVARLLDAAMRREVQNEHGAPVVGALCFGLAREQASTDTNGYDVQAFPTLYDWKEVEHPDGYREPGFKVRPGYQPDALTQVAGTGAAALLVPRRAAERVREVECGGRPEWFEHARYESGTLVSEDLSFCYRLGKVGVRVFVHTGVRTSHMKAVHVDEATYLEDVMIMTLEEQAKEIEHVDVGAGEKD